MQKGKQNQGVRRIVVTGMLAALIAVLMLTGVGLIPIGPLVEITFLCLPVLIGVMAEGLGVGLTLGLAFGAISFIQAFSSPSILAPYFMNPLVSVLPRVLIPVTTWLTVNGLSKLLSKGGAGRVLAHGAAAFVGSLTNTVLVLGMVYVLIRLGVVVEGLDAGAAGALLLGVALSNGLPEAAAMLVVTPPILEALDRSIYQRRGAKT